MRCFVLLVIMAILGGCSSEPNRSEALGWVPVLDLTPLRQNSAVKPAVVTEPGGGVWIVYCYADQVAAVRRTRSQGWTPPETIWKTASPGDCLETAAVTDRNGRVFAIWQHQSGIWAAHFVPGAGWSTAARLGEGSVLYQAPRIAADFTGGALAVWSDRQLPIPGSRQPMPIFAARLLPSGTWQERVQVVTADADVSQAAALALDRNGRAALAWKQDFRLMTATVALVEGRVTVLDPQARGTMSPNSRFSAAIGTSGHLIVSWFDAAQERLLTLLYAPQKGWAQVGGAEISTFVMGADGLATGAGHGSSDQLNLSRASSGTDWEALAPFIGAPYAVISFEQLKLAIGPGGHLLVQGSFFEKDSSATVRNLVWRLAPGDTVATLIADEPPFGKYVNSIMVIDEQGRATLVAVGGPSLHAMTVP